MGPEAAEATDVGKSLHFPRTALPSHHEFMIQGHLAYGFSGELECPSPTFSRRGANSVLSVYQALTGLARNKSHPSPK